MPTENDGLSDESNHEFQEDDNRYADVSETPEESDFHGGEDQEGSQGSDEETEPSEERYRVVVDGQERLVTKDELIQAYSLGLSSTQRYQEAARMRKEIEPKAEVLKALEQGDLSVLNGMIPKEKMLEFSENLIEEILEEQNLSPAEKRAMAAERELKILKEEREQARTAAEKRESERIIAQQDQLIDRDLDQALMNSGLDVKENYALARRVVSDMIAHVERGQEPSAQKSLERVVAKMDEEMSAHIARRFKENPDQFLATIPADFQDAIRHKSIGKIASQYPDSRARRQTTKKQQRPNDRATQYIQNEMRKAY